MCFVTLYFLSIQCATLHYYKSKEWQMAKERQDINMMESEQKWYLKSYVVADLTFFHLVLIHGVDVLLHLYDASSGQRVFTLVLNKENNWSVKAEKRSEVESKLNILEQNYLLYIGFKQYFPYCLGTNCTILNFLQPEYNTTWICTTLMNLLYISHTQSFYLIQPFVVHKPIQKLLTLTLFHFFCDQRVGAV